MKCKLDQLGYYFYSSDGKLKMASWRMQGK